jgi:hypothetical protein
VKKTATKKPVAKKAATKAPASKDAAAKDAAAKSAITKNAAAKSAPAKDAAKEPDKKPKRMAVRVSVNQIDPEPMHILGTVTRHPEVGDVLKVLPDRLQSSVFAKTVKVERIITEAGVTTIYATTF